MAMPARQPGTRCRGKKCSATWTGADKQWATCWTCPGGPHPYCAKCQGDHFTSKACIESHRAQGKAVTVCQCGEPDCKRMAVP